MWVALGCVRLPWAALGCCVAVGCVGIALGCSGLRWVAWGCVELLRAVLSCVGVLRDAVCCVGLRWVVVGCVFVPLRVDSVAVCSFGCLLVCVCGCMFLCVCVRLRASRRMPRAPAQALGCRALSAPCLALRAYSKVVSISCPDLVSKMSFNIMLRTVRGCCT